MAKLGVIIILETVNYPAFLMIVAWQERDDSGGQRRSWGLALLLLSLSPLGFYTRKPRRTQRWESSPKACSCSPVPPAPLGMRCWEADGTDGAGGSTLVLHGPCWVPVHIPTHRFSFLPTKPIWRQLKWSDSLGVFIQNRVRRVNKQFSRKKKIPSCIICLNTLGVLAQTCRSFLYIYGTESNKAEGN